MATLRRSAIQGLLIDLDGVLYVGEKVIPGGVEAVAKTKAAGFPVRFCTNTTTRSLESLHRKVLNMGFGIEPGEIFGVIRAAQLFLERQTDPVCKLLLTDDPRRDFDRFRQADTEVTHIVVGDIGKHWDYDLMNQCFNLIVQGAELIALHKGQYWMTETRLRMDIGAFVAGLEFVTGREATVIGKPSETFFELALADLGLPASAVAMIGDDITGDIEGAQCAGMPGILVKTGKYSEDLVARSKVRPNAVVESIVEAVSLLCGDS
jgi:HAD superfamily hydrolase (TIGR01458 family)